MDFGEAIKLLKEGKKKQKEYDLKKDIEEEINERIKNVWNVLE